MILSLKPQQILPAISTLLNVATCIGYIIAQDWRQAAYWFLCALITVVVAY